MLYIFLFPFFVFIFILTWSFSVDFYSVFLNLEVFNIINCIFIFTFDYVSIICLIMLLSCSIIAIYFYWHYFSWHSDYLIILIQLFILSMLYLVLTNSGINSFIGWEYLGIVSYFLILYFSIYCSARSAFVTIISSRFGDLGFFLFLGILYNDLFQFNNIISVVLFSFLLMSKSAIFPLSSWLLEAMRAPTPVSSLVHSSTLVAAGVWLFSRYYNIFENNNCMDLIFFLSLITVIYSGISAYFYSDSKKIIALSTCNNISWCFIYIYFGCVYLGLIQLLCHGIFKCLLFCLIGDFLSNSYSSQNKSLHYYSSSNSYSIIISLVCLFICGFPFLGVFYTKHLLLGLLNSSINIFIFLFIILGILLSFLYSFRLIKLLNLSSNSVVSGFNNIFYFSILLFPIFFFINNWFSGSILEDFMLGYVSNIMVYLFIVFSCLLGIYVNTYSLNSWFSGFFGQDFIVVDSVILYNKFISVFYNISIFRWEQNLVNFMLSSLLNLRYLSNNISVFLLFLSLFFYFVFILF
nr:NADH dehydrogenase subunit 5 [Gyrodactylus sp. FZ-2021]